jgi:hypothetical protein
LLVTLTTSLLQSRNLRIHRNNFVKPYPSAFFANLTLAISLIAAAVIGVYAVVSDAWTVKLWILFALILCVTIPDWVWIISIYLNI